MSSVLGRYGVRALAVALLLAGVGGGVYLGQQRSGVEASTAAQEQIDAQRAEEIYLKERHGEYTRLAAQNEQATRAAADKAAEAARAQAKRAQAANEAVSRKKQREKEAKAASAPYAGPIPASCEEFSGHRRTGCALMLERGFGIDQFPCLDKLWTKESRWNPNAHNNSSGAHGIPQAVPGSNMASVGADWRTNAVTQIKWGLGYIKGRYGTPCKAWGHSQNKGWY